MPVNVVVQVVWAHPRTDSLTATVAADVIAEIRARDIDVDELDLYRSGFDPVLWRADEPDWDDLDKTYSTEVMQHAARANGADAVVFVFPVWWYSVPAVLKGYIDRVWNHGIFYGGGRRTAIRKIRWIGLAGESQASFAKRKHDVMIEHQLNVGIAGVCGVADSEVELLWDALGEDIDDLDRHFSALRGRAITVAAQLATSLTAPSEGPASS
jgi:putative NADPH-quinone reductase